MEQFKKRVANLISVKSIVTVILTLVFTVLALRGDVTGQDFLTIFLMVISFYFGTQSQKVQDAVDVMTNKDGVETVPDVVGGLPDDVVVNGFVDKDGADNGK